MGVADLPSPRILSVLRVFCGFYPHPCRCQLHHRADAAGCGQKGALNRALMPLAPQALLNQEVKSSAQLSAPWGLAVPGGWTAGQDVCPSMGSPEGCRTSLFSGAGVRRSTSPASLPSTQVHRSGGGRRESRSEVPLGQGTTPPKTRGTSGDTYGQDIQPKAPTWGSPPTCSALISGLRFGLPSRCLTSTETGTPASSWQRTRARRSGPTPATTNRIPARQSASARCPGRFLRIPGSRVGIGRACGAAESSAHPLRGRIPSTLTR